MSRNLLLKPVDNRVDTSLYPDVRFAIIKYETISRTHDTNIFILPNSENHAIMISGNPHELETVDIQWYNNIISEYWHYSFIPYSEIRMSMTEVLLFF